MRSRLALGGLAVAVAVAAALPAAAAAPGTDVPSRRAPAHSVDRDRLAAVSGLPAGLRSDRRVTALVQLADAPVAVRQAEARASARRFDRGDVQRQVRRAQDEAEPALTAAGATVTGRLDTVLNAVRVRVRVRDLGRLAAVPGVRHVQVSRLIQLDNAPGEKFTGVDRTWAETGRTGKGQVIAVVDTGIDYTHADFGGSGDPADYRGNDGTTVEAGTFPTAKVTGGYDFVGDAFDPTRDETATPRPDADPLDCDGHGTHVAGTAAGAGVQGGATYTGTYGKGTLDADFDVAPGVAPQATLKAYKVFGCSGYTSDDVVIAAIERAVKDEVDVVNLSLGSAYGTADDFDAQAITAATRAGVLVVAAAGNSGGKAYLTGSPATTTAALAVAAVNPGNAKVAGFSSGGPRSGDSALKPDLAAPGVDVDSAGYGTGAGSVRYSGTSMATPHTAGVAALTGQAHPTWDAAKLKAALMSTASPQALTGYDPQRAGGGLVQPRRATTTQQFAWTSSGLDSLAFGMNQLSGARSETQSYKITNTSAAAVSYRLSSATAGSARGASVTVEPAVVTVQPRSTATVAVTLSLSRADVAALPGAAASDGGALVTVRGVVTATPREQRADLGPLRMAFLAVPVPTSSVKPASTTVKQSSSGKTPAITVKNRGVHTGTADVFQRLLTDRSGDAVGADAPDLTGVGVQSLLPADGSTRDRVVVFAVTQARSTSTQASTVFELALDTNADGEPDRTLLAADTGVLEGGEPDGTLTSYTLDAAGDVVDAWAAVAPANGSTVLLPAQASVLGLTSTRSAIRVTGWAYSLLDGSRYDELSGTGRYDVFHPALSQGQLVTLKPGRSASIPTKVTSSRVAKQTSSGWLVVTPDDAAGAAEADRVSLKLRP